MPTLLLFLLATLAMVAARTTTLVVGASGATGKHVVAQLLQKGQDVRAIVRSKDRFLTLLDEVEPKASTVHEARLQITEAAILDLSDRDLEEQVEGSNAVVQCLGHTISFGGMYGKPRYLVRDAVERLTNAIASTAPSDAKVKTKFILMGSDGVAHPAGTDDRRPLGERATIALIRALVPPHRDNEAAALYVNENLNDKVDWTVVRPTDLIDGEAGEYAVYDKPQGSLFGGGVTTRANCAKFMVDLILDDRLWKEHVGNMPVVHDAECRPE